MAQRSRKEKRYMEMFINSMTHVRPQEKYNMVDINPSYVHAIKKILFSQDCGHKCSVKAYINNVLAAHFEEYADIINSKIQTI
ncbi:hypothetical protein IMSAGC008_01273 [Muribaculaceae bacterium]|nr:hypothetical protein IMSAGC008_01273 [Muribaculaceae bacterium]